MIKINLLPYDLRPVKRTAAPYVLSGLLLAVAVVVMAGLWIHLYAQIGAQRGQLAQHQKELEGLKAIVDEYNKRTEQKLKLADKMAIIQEIVSDRIIWSRQLYNVSRLTPDNFWYNSIAEKEKTSKESRMVFDEKTKKEDMKTVTMKRRVLEVGGFVIEGPDGSNDIYPLTFKMEQDPEFAALFQFSSPKLVDTEFQGYKVRKFTLEYLITQKGENP
jgi:Tfp pilus assembly protein PilN